MTEVIVLSQTPREGGMVEVKLASGAISWTVHIPEAIADSPDARSVYQSMADTVHDTHLRLSGIVQANRAV